MVVFSSLLELIDLKSNGSYFIWSKCILARQYLSIIFESIFQELNRVAFKGAQKKVYLFIGYDFQGILLSLHEN